MYKLQLTAAFVILAVLAGRPLFAEHGTVYGADLDHVLDFPHFGNGDFVRSELVLVNLGSEAHPAIYFYDSAGEMILAESVVEMTVVSQFEISQLKKQVFVDKKTLIR